MVTADKVAVVDRVDVVVVVVDSSFDLGAGDSLDYKVCSPGTLDL